MIPPNWAHKKHTWWKLCFGSCGSFIIILDSIFVVFAFAMMILRQTRKKANLKDNQINNQESFYYWQFLLLRISLVSEKKMALKQIDWFCVVNASTALSRRHSSIDVLYFFGSNDNCHCGAFRWLQN